MRISPNLVTFGIGPTPRANPRVAAALVVMQACHDITKMPEGGAKRAAMLQLQQSDLQVREGNIPALKASLPTLVDLTQLNPPPM
jgi:hypothetical protein